MCRVQNKRRVILYIVSVLFITIVVFDFYTHYNDLLLRLRSIEINIESTKREFQVKKLELERIQFENESVNIGINAVNPLNDNKSLNELKINPSLDNGFVNLMTSRLEILRSTCKNTAKGSPLQNRNIYWLQRENVAYCPTFKSASSSWLNYLVQITDRPDKEKDAIKTKYSALIQQLRHLGAIYPYTDMSAWSSHIKELGINNSFVGFMVVRHPFDRLVSAYRDKLERNNLEEPYYYTVYGKYFVQKYREKAIKALGKDYFNEINNFGTPIKVLDNRRPNSDLPTFWEFAQSVIERYKMDEHWIPINEYCSICNPTMLKVFQYILKHEELEKEEELFLKHVKWDKKIKTRTKINVIRPPDVSNNDLTQIYFSTLSKDQVMGLYKIYELDFLAFNYTFEMKDLHLPGINK